jgi:predicted RND superfamily exporter protein
LKRIAEFIYDHSRIILVITIIINLVSLASFYRFSFDTDFLAFFTKGNPIMEEYTRLNEKYASGETISVLIENDTSLLEKDAMLDVYRLQNEMAAGKGVAAVQGFIPADVMSGTGIIAVDESYIRENYQSLRNFIKNEYFFTDQFLTEDGSSGIIIVTLEPDAVPGESIDALKEIAGESQLNISFAGNEIIKDTIWDYLLRILLFLPPAAIVLILLVFYLMLRNFKLTIMAIIPAALAALWTFGTIFWSGQKLNLVTVISPMFIIVIGSAYGLHFVSHFLDNMKKYPDRRQLIVETLGMVGTPIFLATITTMAGFISLVWTEVTAMRHMGVFVTVGIAYAGLLALFFVPAVLTRMKIREQDTRQQNTWLTNFVIKASRQRILVPVIFAVIVVVSAVFIPGLRVVSDQLMFFKEDSEIRKTFARVEEHFGGAIPLTGEIVAPLGQQTLLDADYAAEVLRKERELETLPGIRSAFSAFDLLKGINKIATGTDAYPNNPAFLSMLLTQASNTADLSTWASSDGLRMIIRTEGLTTDDIGAIDTFVEENNDIVRTVTGMPMLFNEMNKLVVRSQVQSLGLALALIFIMLWITLRRITAALAGLLPIAITVCVIMGVLVMTDFQLNVLTANLSAIVIGVGVDYSIHLISGIYYYRRQGLSREESVNSALSTVSRPVLANAYGLAIGYSAMFFSPLYIHTQAAGVMWVAMVVSSAAALLLVPIFYRIGKREAKT